MGFSGELRARGWDLGAGSWEPALRIFDASQNPAPRVVSLMTATKLEVVIDENAPGELPGRLLVQPVSQHQRHQLSRDGPRVRFEARIQVGPFRPEPGFAHRHGDRPSSWQPTESWQRQQARCYGVCHS